MTGGDFSPEAYQQLREAYANETNTQLDAENEGVEILGQKMTLETLPVDSPWRSQIDDWQYPSGRSQYLDEKQDPAEILEIMRGSAKKLDDAEKLEEAKELVAEAEGEEAEEVEETEEAEAEADDEDLDEMSDEDFDKFIAEILEEDDGETDGVGDDEVEEESADETEDNDLTNEELDAILEEVGEEDDEEEEEEEEEDEEKENYDPQVVADEISRLKTELDNIRFVPAEEQPEANDESD